MRLPLWLLGLFLLAHPLFAKYNPPNLDIDFIEVSKLSISKEERKELASLIAVQVRNSDFRPSTKDFLSRAFGIALKLDNRNKSAYVGNSKLKRGEALTPVANQEALSKKDFSKAMMKKANPLSESDQVEDNKLAAYLCWIVMQYDKNNDDAIFVYESYMEDHKLDWSWAGGTLANSSSKSLVESGKGKSEDFSKKNKKFTKKLSKVKGLVVQTLPNGDFFGTDVDIIATLQPVNRGRNGTIGFVRSVGYSMSTSQKEAVRYVQRKYPFWEPMDVRLSFGDKYAMKDGGSAGTAFTVLLLSLFEDFEIDEKVAVTGDMTVDGEVRNVGGIGAKVRGAILGKCKLVGIPNGNVDALDDMLLLYPIETLWKIQIFSMKDIDFAQDLLSKKKSSKLKKAIEHFEMVQLLADKNKYFYKKKNAKELLGKILEECPEHMSAKYLLKLANHEKVKKLSMNGSLVKLFSTTTLVNEYIFGRKNPLYIDEAMGKKVMSNLKKIKPILNKETTGLYKVIYDYIYAASKYKNLEKQKYKGNNYNNKYFQKKLKTLANTTYSKHKLLIDKLKSMKADSNFYKKLLAEGH